MGDATLGEVRGEFDKRVNAGEFIGIATRAGAPDRAFTTQEMLDYERDTILLKFRIGKKSNPTCPTAVCIYSKIAISERRARVGHLGPPCRMAPLEREEPPLCDFSLNDSLSPGESCQAAIAIPFTTPYAYLVSRCVSSLTTPL
jgi:hypothetical protein